MVDLRATLYGGQAFLQAVRDARPQVLEPIVHIEITAPDHTVGDITGDLSSRRGVVVGTANGMPGSLVVHGLVPLAALSSYQTQTRLNALTSGRGQGRYAIRLAHFAAVPPAAQAPLMAAFKAHDKV